jgi:hypothetical protein
MKKLYFFILFLLSLSITTAQTYTMQNGTETTCSGTFYDSGGAGGNYSNGENFEYTFCPTNPGDQIRFDFSAIDLEACCDDLLVYNGNSSAAPLYGDAAVGQFTSTDASGCLTFVFTSDGSITRSGWEAVISCITPCTQTIVANIDATTPAVSANGVIEICEGDAVDFVGSGTFSGSNAGAVYTWDFGDGNTGVGANVTHNYPIGVV